MKVCGDREKARAYYQRKTGLDRSELTSLGERVSSAATKD
jgi:hypothetical protein